jgi:putative ATP-binding cassette transporter
MISIDRRAWSRFVKISKPFFTSETRWRAWGGVALLIVLLLTLTGLNVANSYVGRHFMTAIAEHEANRYLRFAVLYVGIFAISTVFAVFYQFTQSRLALLWRQRLTQHFINQYLSSHAYCRIIRRDEIDNPDQRISQDINTFTQMAVSFFVSLLNSIITILAFAAVLWSISPWLLLVALGYAVIGWVLTIFLGQRLVGLNNLQLKKEADLRYELVRTREYADTIALSHGEKQENVRLGGKLRSVVENYKAIIAVVRNVGFFTSMFRYLVPLIPALIVAPRYIRGEIEFGVITQAAEVFARILDQATSLITQQFQSLSEFAAVVARLGTLWDTMTEAAAPIPTRIEIVKDDSRVAYERLTLRTPKEGRLLINALSIDVPHGQRLLIEGPNGAGKSALFRATAGIWLEGEGRIFRPHRAQMMVLPQRPYTIPGSLREQLLYGLPGYETSDDRLLAALRAVKFEAVLERIGGLDAEHNWSNMLSAGEQQLLALARLLVANPPFALLDQAVCALEPQRGKQLYQVLSKTTISYISVADCTLLQEYHDTVLELQNDGQWKVRPAQRRAGAVSRGS